MEQQQERKSIHHCWNTPLWVGNQKCAPHRREHGHSWADDFAAAAVVVAFEDGDVVVVAAVVDDDGAVAAGQRNTPDRPILQSTTKFAAVRDPSDRL